MTTLYAIVRFAIRPALFTQFIYLTFIYLGKYTYIEETKKRKISFLHDGKVR